jgi:hypothetical protein
MNPSHDPGASVTPNPADGLKIVRYSLPALLREVEAERNVAAFAMEKLDQAEIGKLFQKPRPRRALKNRK